MLLRNSSVSLLATLGLIAGATTISIALPLAAEAQSQEADYTTRLCENQNIDLALQISIGYYRSGDFENALLCLDAILRTAQAITDVSEEINYSYRIGLAYLYQGEIYSRWVRYPEAIESLEYAEFIFDSISQLVVSEDVTDCQARTLEELGTVSSNLGDYDGAISYFEKSLSVLQEDRSTRCGVTNLEAAIHNNLGLALMNSGEYARARRSFQVSLNLGSNTQSEVTTQGNIARTLALMGRYEEALEIALEVLAFRQETVVSAFQQDNDGALYRLSITLNDLGYIYLGLQQFDEALNSYQQSLVIAERQNNLDRQALTLQRIGELYLQKGDSTSAIVFLKQSVNRSEAFRQSLIEQGLSITGEQSYVQAISVAYRLLADLLLQQGRILEAQQVLELLKVQELREFTDDERAGGEVPEVTLLPQEAAILAEFTTLIAFGQQLRNCEATRCANLSSLRDQRDQQFSQYRTAVASLTTFIQDRLEEGDDPNLLLNPTGFATKAEEIIDQQPGTVVVYPLVLEDKLWLLWAADGRVISRREIPVSRVELGNAVIEFRALIEDRNSDIAEVQALGQQLYTWLIAPIEAELAASQDIQHLVFSLDRTTRYLPMGALYDGEQYLIEKYTVATILSAALTDVSQRSPVGTEGVSILGAGVSQASGEFHPLPYVPRELDAIIRNADPTDTEGLYAGSTLLDPDFTYSALRDSLDGQQILHIATHGKFVPGNRDGSFLLLGDGTELPIPDIETLGTYLEDVHLVVLSACQTALGGPNEEGLEIAGLGYYFLNSQVDAVMASLWNVSDASTSLLMQRFYANLAQGTTDVPITKAEALQAAQLSFIQSPDTLTDDDIRFIYQRQGDTTAAPLSHPYYWAPFILIGNSL
jgi:CHAT domain-containing protein